MSEWIVGGDAEGRPTDRTCAHLAGTAAEVDEPGDACEDCVREGTSWVHLRQCFACGGVRCCDSSPRRHSTAHHRATGHPVMRSAQPGESWGWCYVDDLMLVPAP